MHKKAFAQLISIGGLVMFTQTQAFAEEAARTTVTEIAIVRIKDEALGKHAQDVALNTIATWPGFIQSVKLTATDDPTLVADIVLWESLELALSASDRFKTDTGVTEYRQAVSELIITDHFVQLGDESDWNVLPGDGVLETAITTVKDPNVHEVLQQAVHTHLENQSAYKNGWRLQGRPGEALSVDLINWTNKDAAEETAKSVMADPAYSSFFEGVQDMHYFGFFTVRGVVEAKK